jgi:hypothetical protein
VSTDVIGQQVEDAHPEWAYLFDPSLAVRPPSADEVARSAALAAPAGPVISLPSPLPVAGALEPLQPPAPEAAPEPEPLGPLPADPAQAAADRAQADSEAALARWGATETIPAVPAAEDKGE